MRFFYLCSSNRVLAHASYMEGKDTMKKIIVGMAVLGYIICLSLLAQNKILNKNQTKNDPKPSRRVEGEMDSLDVTDDIYKVTLLSVHGYGLSNIVFVSLRRRDGKSFPEMVASDFMVNGYYREGDTIQMSGTGTVIKAINHAPYPDELHQK